MIDTEIYATPSMTIGKHEWRVVVIPSRYGSYCTEYQFRRTEDHNWKPQDAWPRYNINDGMYMGLPKSLVRLYDQHKDEIKAAIEGQPVPLQADLFQEYDPSRYARLQPQSERSDFDRMLDEAAERAKYQTRDRDRDMER